MAPADQTTDPDGTGGDADALIRALGVSAGDRLDGRYRLDRVLHTTGPAVTWLATDEKLNRPSRIHLLRSDQPRAEAFMAAARAAAAMADNHFVQVLDAVPDEGLYYVITEWLHDGHTLGEVLAQGPVPVGEAVRITQELARAMAEAHEQGLAHLRLSPKTVLRTDTGEVKILDLCLAAALTGTVSRDPLGTDLSAIGELAYALLTGKRPQAQPTAPSELRPEITPQLDEVVLRILGESSAGEPFASPNDVADALAQLPRPRFEAPLPSTPQTAPLRHQQTTVMPAASGRPTTTMPPAPAYQQPAPAARPATRSATSHGGHGGSHRPAAYDDGDYGRGGRRAGGGRLSSKAIGIGAVAAVAVIAVAGYSLFSGDGKTGNGATGSTSSTSQNSSSQSSDSPSAVGGPITVSNVAVYDGDDGSEGKGYIVNGQLSSKGWVSSSYCQDYGTQNRQPKAGTGLVFDLGANKQITDVTVNVALAGGAMEMWVGDSSVTGIPAEVTRSAPANFTKVASSEISGTTVDLKPSSTATGRFVLVWFTKLAKEPTPNPKIPQCSSTYANTISGVKFAGP